MNFSEKLARIIEASGKSQSQVQRETGISQSAISEMTKGKRRPYMDQALLLARSLGVTLDYLADNALDEPPPPIASLSEADRLVLGLVHELGHAESLRRLAIGVNDPPLPSTRDRPADRNRPGPK